MSETLTIEGLLTDYARCLKAYFEEGCHDEVYEAQGKAGSAIVAAFDAQAARITELEAMLARLEYAGGAHATEDMCPLCCALENRPHEPGCELAALLHKE